MCSTWSTRWYMSTYADLVSWPRARSSTCSSVLSCTIASLNSNHATREVCSFGTRTLMYVQLWPVFSPPCMVMADRSYSVGCVDVGARISLEALEVPLAQNEDMSNRAGIVQGVWSFVSTFLQLSKPKRLSPIARTVGSVSRTKKVVRVTG